MGLALRRGLVRLSGVVVLTGAGAVALAQSAAALPAGCSVLGSTVKCTYTSGSNPVVLPVGVSSINVTAIGGMGGSAQVGTAAVAQGGHGDAVSGTLAVTPASTIYAVVAGNGAAFNNGGGGGGANGGAASGGCGGGGGGASDIRTAANDPTTRLLVAAGGGGATCDGFDGNSDTYFPGAAGGSAGQPGADSNGGGGGAGTATAGGAGGSGGSGVGYLDDISGTSGTDGQLAAGGAGGSSASSAGGGGGGGLYGGGGGGGGGASPGEGFFFVGGGGGGGSDLVPSGGTASGDTTGQPEVVISYQLPASSAKVTKAKINAKHRLARFTFSATGPETSFQCALVHKPASKHKKTPKPNYAACRSPKTYKHLKHGRYTFFVRPVNTGIPGTPARKYFKIT